jgi:hypothetical protein
MKWTVASIASLSVVAFSIGLTGCDSGTDSGGAAPTAPPGAIEKMKTQGLRPTNPPGGAKAKPAAPEPSAATPGEKK